MKNFAYWLRAYNNANLSVFNGDKQGLLWLKTKSIIRKDLLDEFTRTYKIKLLPNKLSLSFCRLFNILRKDIGRANLWLDEFSIRKNKEQLATIDLPRLVSELYKLKSFIWGGDYQNSLDKYLISRYVKVCAHYDELTRKLTTDIPLAVQGYVLNSWYNHWSSILIEHIFKAHPAILPTIGKIKNVDFFLGNIPFDLKVTYFPAEFIKSKRREKKLPTEITYLKTNAKKAGITFDHKAKDVDLIYEITEKMRERNDDDCRKTLTTLKSEKTTILQEVQRNPKILAKWLYENQGEMRFSAENRLFLVLVDRNDFTNSWKLKRNLDFLKPVITNYLSKFKKQPANLTLDFVYREKSYKALADVIFAIQ